MQGRQMLVAPRFLVRWKKLLSLLTALTSAVAVAGLLFCALSRHQVLSMVSPGLEAFPSPRGLRANESSLYTRPDPDLSENQTFWPTKPDACLRFIHVPKTGGTTIEDVHHNALQKPDRRVKGWGRFGEGLRRPKDMPLEDKFSILTYFGIRKCYGWHVPPMSIAGLWEESYDMCDTFCVVRDPLDKLVSEWQYANKNQGCNSSHFAEWVRPMLAIIRTGDIYRYLCHWLPQHHFVYHYSPDGLPKRMCNHVLRFERLRDDFNGLMQAYGYQLRMGDQQSNTRATCNIDIPEDIRAVNREVYAIDYGLFGYK